MTKRPKSPVWMLTSSSDILDTLEIPVIEYLVIVLLTTLGTLLLRAWLKEDQRTQRNLTIFLLCPDWTFGHQAMHW